MAPGQALDNSSQGNGDQQKKDKKAGKINQVKYEVTVDPGTVQRMKKNENSDISKAEINQEGCQST